MNKVQQLREKLETGPDLGNLTNLILGCHDLIRNQILFTLPKTGVYISSKNHFTPPLPLFEKIFFFFQKKYLLFFAELGEIVRGKSMNFWVKSIKVLKQMKELPFDTLYFFKP